MQYDPNKQGSNYYANTQVNQYPPMSQPQFGTGHVYPPNNAPPPYSQYPHQPAGYPSSGAPYHGQTPVYQQQGVAITPAYRSWNHLTSIPITSSLKTYLLISGILYLLWGILSIGLEIGIIINSYSTYYRGFWVGGFLIGSAISLLIASNKASYVLTNLIRMLAIALFLCVFGFILSIVNLALSNRCGSSSSWWYYCDYTIATNLKIVILVVFLFAIIHTIVSIATLSKAQKKTTCTPASNVPTY